ncbi:MAG: hypothetical protein Q7S63_01625 [bacterium]|nr:hypothetical protein [bacterium]
MVRRFIGQIDRAVDRFSRKYQKTTFALTILFFTPFVAMSILAIVLGGTRIPAQLEQGFVDLEDVVGMASGIGVLVCSILLLCTERPVQRWIAAITPFRKI